MTDRNWRNGWPLLAVVVSGLFLALAIGMAGANQDSIDWNRARELLRKSRQGEELTVEERDYLDHARQERQNLRQKRTKGSGEDMGKTTTGLVPLTEMGERKYKGEQGGLYGAGRNVPPPAHQKAAARELGKITPLDAEGIPSPQGKIVLISIGMSNTTHEFSEFKKIADRDPQKSPQVVIVDCAQGGQDAADWADPEHRFKKERPSPWSVLPQRLKAAGVTAPQVQVAWIKQVRRRPESLGAFPAHARELQAHLVTILNKLKERFPNLRVAYLSSRIYAGYATSALNPEPYAYESAFTMRWLIRDQIKGEPKLNYDPERGKVKSPLLLWGPYFWADGLTARKADKLVWERKDLAGDGTHPSASGRQKVARLLLNFFKTDRGARKWFLSPSALKEGKPQPAAEPSTGEGNTAAVVPPTDPVSGQD